MASGLLQLNDERQSPLIGAMDRFFEERNKAEERKNQKRQFDAGLKSKGLIENAQGGFDYDQDTIAAREAEKARTAQQDQAGLLAKGMRAGSGGSVEFTPEQAERDALERRKLRSEAQRYEALARNGGKSSAGVNAPARGSTVPGFDIEYGAAPTKEDANKVKSAVQFKKDFDTNLSTLLNSVDQHGTESFGANSDLQNQLATDLRVQAKELYNLGALSGPDMALIQSVIPDPSDRGWAITPNAASRVKAGLERAREIVNTKYQSGLSARGYKPQQQQQPQGQGLLPPQGLISAPRKAVREELQEGMVEDGYKYIGGDPADPESWEPI